MTVEGAEYQFVAWARTGMGTILDGAEKTVRIQLGGAGEVPNHVAPYGPGDVTALDTRAIIRTVPRTGALDFEPNLFPSVELAHPALPWLLSPPADANHRLTPWIVLVVVEEQAGVALASGGGNTQILTIDAPASVARELPDLTQAWAWAHGQTTGAAGAPIQAASLARSGGEARGRLVAARRLEPGKTYLACLVPAFAASVAAALGGGPQTGLAWTRTETSLRLPVYYSWRFGTGPGGDFASLVKLIQPEPLGDSVGHRSVDLGAPGWGLPASPGAAIEVSGALRSSKWSPPDLTPAVQALGTQLLAEIDAAADTELPGTPVMAPPFYGSVASRQERVATAPTWQTQLNDDVRQRSAAGLGAAVVRANLDALVEGAWRAAGDAERANDAIRHAELAGEITTTLAAKHVRAIADDGEALAVARPLWARMHAGDVMTARARARAPGPVAAGPTLASAVKASAMPNAALMAGLRRLGRPQGVIARASAAPVMTGAMIAKVDARAIVPVPPKALPEGAAGFDQISQDAHERPRYRAATSDAVDEAAAHWRSLHTTARRHAAPAAMRSRRRVTDVPDGEGDWTPDPISTNPDPDPTAVDEFASAAARHQAYIVTQLERIPDVQPKPLGAPNASRPLATLRARIESQWDPERGIIPLLQSRLGAAASDLATVDAAVPFQPLSITPVLEQPLVRNLQALSPEHVLPGIGDLTANRASLVDTAPEFVRAFLVGANEQLGRELLWRGFPGALGHTWMQTFWGRTVLGAQGASTAIPDIPPIEAWPDAGPPAVPATLVLLVRADVLHRYPNAVIYAVAAKWDGVYRVPADDQVVLPVVATTLGNDVALFGFDLTDDVARGSDAPPASPGWYFAIAEHPSEPRFGLAASPASAPGSWQDIAWSDVAAGDLAGEYLRVDGPLAARVFADEPRWGTDAGAMAAITRRRAIRVAIHASMLMG